MFEWLGKSKKSRSILNELYGTIQKTQLEKARREIDSYHFFANLEKNNKNTTKV
jgi:hypothetical protein